MFSRFPLCYVTLAAYCRGAFLLAADGGLQGGCSQEGGDAAQEPVLSNDGPTCLKKVRRSVHLGWNFCGNRIKPV